MLRDKLNESKIDYCNVIKLINDYIYFQFNLMRIKIF